MKKILFIFILIILFFFAKFVIGNDYFISVKTLFDEETKQYIKKYLKPELYKQEQLVKLESHNAISKELDFKKENFNVILETPKEIILSNNKKIKKYRIKNGFYAGIHNNTPGTGYIDFYKEDILILSSRGILIFGKFNENLLFQQIKNNINDFIDLPQFKKDKLFSIKDLLILDNEIYVSYIEEIKENCWNTSILKGDINYDYIKFKKFFSSKNCIKSKDNLENEFNASQSGGRIIKLDHENILLSVGDYRNRYLAQDLDNINGKIIKINILNKDYEIISLGHRNPQGLYLDLDRKFILETEHGPQGGDEINLIELDKINNKEKLNYGWPVVSAGEHYGKDSLIRKKKYKKYPLYKSHTEYGFIEPLKSFVPSIGISEVIKIKENHYLVGSMKDKALYFFNINNKKKITNLEKVDVFERVRDLKISKNKVYFFLEDTPSIGIMSMN